MTYLRRHTDGTLSDDFTRAVDHRAQALANVRHTQAMACYADALIETRREQPELWDAHENFRLAAGGDPRMLDAGQRATWERFTASDERARQMAEYFAARGVELPQAVLAMVDACDSLSADEQGQLLQLLTSVLHDNPVSQSQAPAPTEAVKQMFDGMLGMGHYELELLAHYLSSLIHGSAPAGNASQEHQALHQMAHQRRLGHRISEVRAGLK